jgi:MurNAc alpha-1-phosphate uridylyltransferase
MNKLKIKQLIILNGGYGKRVKSISKNKPKCLITFNKKPFIYWQLLKYEKAGVEKILLCLGHKNLQIINFLKKVKFKKLKIKIVSEKFPLGTGGAIKNCKKYLDTKFMITYGDSWLDLDLRKLINKFNSQKKENLITAIKKENVTPHKANLLIKKNKIIEYNKKSIDFNYVEYGFMILNKKSLNSVKKNKFDLSLIISNLIKIKNIQLIKIKKKFYEIGSLKGIQKFKVFFKNEIHQKSYN